MEEAQTDRRHSAIARGAFDQARERLEHAAKGVCQNAKLEAAGIIVAPLNADAAKLALACLQLEC